MSIITRTTTSTLKGPTISERNEASLLWGDKAAHERFMKEWDCMTHIESMVSQNDQVAPSAFTIGAWNIERCKRVEESAKLVSSAGVDVLLATEMDHGMARSAQRHTIRDMADVLGFHAVFGVEFVELGIGDTYESEIHAGQVNKEGLHGNAILSRWPISRPAVITLDSGGGWFVKAPKSDGQYRVGGRIAIAATLDTVAGPVRLVSVHLESESNPDERNDQIQRLLSVMNEHEPCERSVIAGDLNTNSFSKKPTQISEIVNTPGESEPCFHSLKAAGFNWRHANSPHFTTRVSPDRIAKYPLQRLDWLLTRRLNTTDANVVAAVSAYGNYLSDHELITASIRVL